MKEKILKLRNEGKTYTEIQNILGCSKGTISYHCGKGQKEKSNNRLKKLRKEKSLLRKIQVFKNRTNDFQRDRGKNREYDINFTYQDVLDKIGDNPICYLTGKPIKLNDIKSFQLDHRIPVSKGGDNSLENLELTLKKANQSKHDMTLEEYLELCTEVLKYNGYKVIDTYINILEKEPFKEYCKCKVITNLGRTVEVDYYNEYGIFWDEDGNELGWINNGENPELVLKWKEI